MSTRVLAALTASAASLRPSEQKVAAFVASDPHAAMRMSISVLAQAANVSEPTVLRFCRALGYKGFIDFKLGMAGDLGGGTRQVFAGIKSNYDPAQLVGRLTVMVANLAPRKMRFGLSEGMILAASDERGIAGRRHDKFHRFEAVHLEVERLPFANLAYLGARDDGQAAEQHDCGHRRRSRTEDEAHPSPWGDTGKYRDDEDAHSEHRHDSEIP